MKTYLKKNVLEAARQRINYIFDEFPDVIVGFSGGKDSSTIFHLVLEIAKERNRLPLPVLFVDQEAEHDTVIDYIKEIMYRDDVKPMWFQMPIQLFNGTSAYEPWLYCWKEGAEWMRPKDPISIKENKYGTTRFHKLFEAIVAVEYPDRPVAYIAGVRAEENPTRMMGVTQIRTYKHATWGKVLNKKLSHYTFYPIYDWTLADVWKYLHHNTYCRIYDYMYNYGIPGSKMRVSNLHHETAIKTLEYLHEVEPGTWNKMVKRLRGINTAGVLKNELSRCPRELPYMFDSWREYREFLLDKLIFDPTYKAKYRKEFDRMDNRYPYPLIWESMMKIHITTILINDFDFTKLSNWEMRPLVNSVRKYYEKGILGKHVKELLENEQRTKTANNPGN